MNVFYYYYIAYVYSTFFTYKSKRLNVLYKSYIYSVHTRLWYTC